MKKIVLFIYLFFILNCVSFAHDYSKDNINIDHPIIKVVKPNSKVGAGYMKIINKSNEGDSKAQKYLEGLLKIPFGNIRHELDLEDNECKKLYETFNNKYPDQKIKDKNVKLGIRSEFINVTEKEGQNTIKASLTRVEDFGNFKLLTANMGDFVIKSKVDRELPISNGDINLYIPPEKCCVYINEKLI